MARITMIGGFQIMPEGEHILKITAAEYEEDFGKVTLTLANVKGQTLVERFSLLNQDGTPNERALNAFSFFAKNAMNDFDMEDIDPVELIGHYIKAEVIHRTQPNRNDPTKMTTFANLGNKSPADGFEGVPATKTTGLDLSALLGN